MRLIQILLGIATAIIVSLLAILGIKTFYPEPQQPARLIEMKPFPYRTFACEKGDAPCVERENEYYAEQQQAQEEENRARRDYEAALRVYNRGFFMAANVVGILVFLAGFFLVLRASLAGQGVLLGSMVAGLYTIIHGYLRGWDSTNDQVKFLVGLVVAVVIIGGSVFLLDRASRTSKTP